MLLFIPERKEGLALEPEHPELLPCRYAIIEQAWAGAISAGSTILSARHISDGDSHSLSMGRGHGDRVAPLVTRCDAEMAHQCKTFQQPFLQGAAVFRLIECS
jgi:hypothetical protein